MVRSGARPWTSRTTFTASPPVWRATTSAASVRWWPSTQGTLIRLLLQLRAVPDATSAVIVLGLLCKHPRHRFWPDALDYLQVHWQGVLGTGR